MGQGFKVGENRNGGCAENPQGKEYEETIFVFHPNLTSDVPRHFFSVHVTHMVESSAEAVMRDPNVNFSPLVILCPITLGSDRDISLATV